MLRIIVSFCLLLSLCSCSATFKATWKVLDDGNDSIYYKSQILGDTSNIYVENIVIPKNELEHAISLFDTANRKSLFHTIRNVEIILSKQVNVEYNGELIPITAFLVSNRPFENHTAYRVFYNRKYGMLIVFKPEVSGVYSYYKIVEMKKGRKRLFPDIDYNELTEVMFSNQNLFPEGVFKW